MSQMRISRTGTPLGTLPEPPRICYTYEAFRRPECFIRVTDSEVFRPPRICYTYEAFRRGAKIQSPKPPTEWGVTPLGAPPLALGGMAAPAAPPSGRQKGRGSEPPPRESSPRCSPWLLAGAKRAGLTAPRFRSLVGGLPWLRRRGWGGAGRVPKGVPVREMRIWDNPSGAPSGG